MPAMSIKKAVGITGGIGSGKSVVCRVFATLGIPVFSADDAARYLMEHDKKVQTAILELLGTGAYSDGKLNRMYVSEKVYGNKEKLQQLNAIVHPATIAFGKQWMAAQTAPYTIKEAAIFFESGSHAAMDVMIGVYAPKELRIKRAMERSALSREKVESIMAQQMDEDEKMKRCDHVITNDDLEPLIPQVLSLHETLIA